MDQQTAPGRLIGSLSGLRMLAAVTVVYVHSANAFVSVVPLRAVASVSYPVVDLFFLLSGFVITWTWRTGTTGRAFWRRRAARIVPTHVLTWAVAVPVVWMEINHLRVGQSLAALFFVGAFVPDPSWYLAGNGAAWSLTGEFVFYAMVPAVLPVLLRMPTRRLLQTCTACIVVVQLVAIVASLFVPRHLQIGLVYVNPLVRMLECWAGACLAVLFARGWRPRLPLWLPTTALFGTLAVLAVLSVRLDDDLPAPAVAFARQILPDGVVRPVGIALLLPVWVLLLAGLAARELAGRPVRALAWRPLVTASTWTYALYMTHGPVVKIVNGALTRTDITIARTTVGGLVTEAVFMVGAVVLAWASYTWFERPLERRLRGGAHPPVPALPTQRSLRRTAVAEAVAP
jgi:peptidoglycan/LPS O-acetylase OafA/YrhL